MSFASAKARQESLGEVAAAIAGPRGVGSGAIFGWWLLVFLIAMVVYVATADQGPQWQDSGWQQIRIITGDIEHPMGLALMHPLHFYLGRASLALLCGVEPAFAITLVSCIAGAVAVANIAATVLLLTGNRRAAFLAACVFMLSHTFWDHATHTESYALVAALMTAEWFWIAAFAVTGRWPFLALLALTSGLGLANHVLASLAVPMNVGIIAWAVLSRRAPAKLVPVAIAAWLVASLPYTAIIVQHAQQSGDWPATIRSALMGKYSRDVLNTALSAKMLALALGFVLYNLPNLTLPLAAHALYHRSERRPPLVWLWPVQLTVYTLFVARYSIADQYTFFFPVYGLLAVLAGLGFAYLLREVNPRLRTPLLLLAAITAMWQPMVYIVTTEVVRARGLFTGVVGSKPYRDGWREFFLPWGDRACAETVNEVAYRLAGPNGLILSDDAMITFAVRYEQVIGRKPASVRIEELHELRKTSSERASIAAAMQAGRPVVLIPRERDKPAPNLTGATWERHGDLYVLTRFEP